MKVRETRKSDTYKPYSWKESIGKEIGGKILVYYINILQKLCIK